MGKYVGGAVHPMKTAQRVRGENVPEKHSCFNILFDFFSFTGFTFYILKSLKNKKL